ncbi:MAG: RagB/SusD family nutrient uptake outer membrane protein [Chitinophagaceae bacterium]
MMGYFPLIGECYTDDGTTGGYDVIDLNEISYRAVTPANIYITQTCNAIYNTVYTANKIINNIDAVPFLDAGEHDNTLAEALFVRALADFDLLRFWGEHWDRSSPLVFQSSTMLMFPGTCCTSDQRVGCKYSPISKNARFIQQRCPELVCNQPLR